MTLRLKRAYETPEEADGTRVLVDRLWPRGLSKENARIDYWAKEVAPSTELRQWYHRDPSRWEEFQSRYFAELDANTEAVLELVHRIGDRPATLVFSARNAMNNAVALKRYLAERMS
jgi:uncharacterized protein YeaO (DUF488 family)